MEHDLQLFGLLVVFAADSDPADSHSATANKTHSPFQSEAFYFPVNISSTAVLTSCCASQPEKKVLPSKTQANKLLAGANVGLEGAPTGGGYFSLNACGCNTLRAGCFTHLRTQCCLGNQSCFFFCFFFCVSFLPLNAE